MPTYEYQCRECGNRFERFQKMTDPAVTECPSCGGNVRKLMHLPAIAFKGPGFYVNDYKSSGTASSAKPAAPVADEAAPPKAASEKTDEQKQEMKELIGA